MILEKDSKTAMTVHNMKLDPWKTQQIMDDIWYMLHNSKPSWNLDEENTFFNDCWIISDTHFNHKKIQEYCDRPDGWQNLIIQNWNSVVKPDDVVIHLGDFSFGPKDIVKPIVDKLNGTIFMVKGNHDRHGKGWYEDVGIYVVAPFMVHLNESDDVLYFTHRRIKEDDFYGVNIHGHIHQKGEFIRIDHNAVYVNVSVEQIDYTPIKISECIKNIVDKSKSLYDTSSMPLSVDNFREIQQGYSMKNLKNNINVVNKLLKDVPVYHITSDDITCVDIRKVPDEYRDEFDYWLRGQTSPLVNGSYHYVYSWDWIRYVNMKFKGTPTYWD